MAEREIYPLTFDPVFKDYPWGGRNLGNKLGRLIPDGIVAESWEIAAHPNGSSTVNNGPLAGLTLAQVQAQMGLALLGENNQDALARGKFPLLIKLLDANRWLSVQVHPGDEYALAHENEWGKTEMWVVLHAEAGAEIIFGFKPGVTCEHFAQAIADHSVERWLQKLPVAAGDVVFVPSGMVHALGPGIIVAEVQQNSDVTYRIYDWGRPRPIHVQQALDVLDFTQIMPTVLAPTYLVKDAMLSVEQIGVCPYFETERIALPAGGSFFGFCDGSTFEIWAVLNGAATVDWAGGALTLTGVSWALLPAALGEYQVTAAEQSVLLRVVTPEG
ncbi:MAG: class I mannose-6-phosphate isomerase [Caldilineaceae bacterium]|nr:class I mannose-6-phosphate isomerase [Caldilineaceae bacterium]